MKHSGSCTDVSQVPTAFYLTASYIYIEYWFNSAVEKQLENVCTNLWVCRLDFLEFFPANEEEKKKTFSWETNSQFWFYFFMAIHLPVLSGLK